VVNLEDHLKNLNLETRFDENLRDIAACPEDMTRAIDLLKSSSVSVTTPPEQLGVLGRLGNFQRILGHLDDAATTLRLALSIANSEAGLLKLKIANMIRLGHVYHWKREFERAHQIFDDCIESINSQSDLSDYLDFAYQHKGKCFFDEARFKEAMECFYRTILLRSNKSDRTLADSTLLAIEETKRRCLPQVSDEKIGLLLSDRRMPDIVRNVIGKRHGNELWTGRFNCINAAMAFHDLAPLEANSSVASPADFLRILIQKTLQIFDFNDFQFGDFVVWWNRSGGSWDERLIRIEEMDLESPGFPYGLIFDHVAIRVRQQIVFNKPNPSPDSEYRFDFLDSAAYPSRLGRGHEMTVHRIRR
jgi:tetratricopeptide (TPR) repeat protein